MSQKKRPTFDLLYNLDIHDLIMIFLAEVLLRK